MMQFLTSGLVLKLGYGHSQALDLIPSMLDDANQGREEGQAVILRQA